ncbi:ATPase, T2SS/T4P/T4SS family [Streptomyces sp. SL13]|uniref:ATPase, T2SS/T4P/T4SS family n=1 Tax=Streptantibioticus silvisoli TaxID=2705255 RepID=A0AA90HFL1_9ACTN|nr:ATPase, T2SS/T4P/T4SS family [Streptantibioticus silvisoli]
MTGPEQTPWASTAGTAEKQLADQLREQVADRMAAYAHAREEAGLPPEDAAQRRLVVRRLLADEFNTHAADALAAGKPLLEAEAEQRIEHAVLNALFGLGPLELLLADERVENIAVNGADTVWVRHADGTKHRAAPLAASDEELVDTVRQIAARTGSEERRFDRATPRLNVCLPDGSRLFAVMAVTGRVSLSIRRHRFRAATLTDLVRLGMCDEPMAGFLGALVRARRNAIVAGGTNVGKTTLLRALASAIPPDERLVTIEDTFELGLDADPVAHPDVVAMQAREANIEGEGAVNQAELVRWGLRMSPDRVIVGEIRGAEVVPMCNAMSQGNDGSLSTIHASTSRGVFTKLAAYAAQAPERLPLEATNLLVASAVHFVIHLTWDADGRRVIDSVREIVDADGSQVITNEVFQPGPDRRAVPAAPLREETLSDLVAVGLDEHALYRQRWGHGR